MRDCDGRHLIVRADANIQMGIGHLMRSLALGQSWKDNGGQVIFITTCHNEALLQRLRLEGFDVRVLSCPHPDPLDRNTTKEILQSNPEAWVVLDGYHFDETYQQSIRDAGHRLLMIDDTADLDHYYADIVLNQNLHAEHSSYSCEPYTILLLGTRYVLLRREFVAWKERIKEPQRLARNVLVTLGGADPENYTLKVFQALQQVDVPGMFTIIVIGASNPHADELESALKKNGIRSQLVKNAQNMPELMAWTDIAISSAGTITWELFYFGIPVLFLIVADNQVRNAEQIQQKKLGINLGYAEELVAGRLAAVFNEVSRNIILRSRLSENARQIVDGLGSQRIVDAMQELDSPGISGHAR